MIAIELSRNNGFNLSRINLSFDKNALSLNISLQTDSEKIINFNFEYPNMLHCLLDFSINSLFENLIHKISRNIDTEYTFFQKRQFISKNLKKSKHKIYSMYPYLSHVKNYLENPLNTSYENTLINLYDEVAPENYSHQQGFQQFIKRNCPEILSKTLIFPLEMLENPDLKELETISPLYKYVKYQNYMQAKYIQPSVKIQDQMNKCLNLQNILRIIQNLPQEKLIKHQHILRRIVKDSEPYSLYKLIMKDFDTVPELLHQRIFSII